MDILYLGYVCNQELFEDLCKNDSDISIASHKYEMCLMKELAELRGVSDGAMRVRVISYLPIKSAGQKARAEELYGFPITYVSCERNSPQGILRGIYDARKLIHTWLEETAGKERVVLSYATNPVLLGAMFSFHHRPPVVTICSEVPNLRIMTNGGKWINEIKKAAFNFFNHRMDGYIFMSQHMNALCNKKGRPWIVVEGMTEIAAGQKTVEGSEKPQPATIFYAGGLFQEYGIDILLECAAQLEGEGIHFVLCGDGNAKAMAEAYDRGYSNIHFLGVRKNDEVMEMERRATLLINPRKPDNLISRYSFPSKTFEYFSTGTPCIITKLDGIPEEYYQYCYTCDVTNADTLANSIRGVLAVPKAERTRKAREALFFLEEKKSAKAQTRKIVAFLDRVGSAKQ